MNHKEQVARWIESRKTKNELVDCFFTITVPNVNINKYDDQTFKKICNILDKYKIPHQFVDTVPGAWNLNRDWIETGVISCAIEYCGVYPANWDIEDIIDLENMESSGQIIILVTCKDSDGNRHLNS